MSRFPLGLVLFIPATVWYCWVWFKDPHRIMRKQAKREIRWLTSDHARKQAAQSQFDTELGNP